MKGLVRTAATALVLVVLGTVALRSGAGRVLPASPAEAEETLRVEVTMAPTRDIPSECELTTRTHYRDSVGVGGGRCTTGSRHESVETIDDRYEVHVSGICCGAEPLVVEVRDPGRLSVATAVQVEREVRP